MRVALLAALALLGGCYSPSLSEGFSCDPDPSQQRCPEGFVCGLDDKCYRELPSPGIDSGMMADGGPATDGGPLVRPPLMVGFGGRVAMARSSTGARLAWQEPAGAGAAAAIRYIDVGNDGTHGAAQSYATSNVARGGLIGAGQSVPFFAWIEGDAQSSETIMITTNAGGAQALATVPGQNLAGSQSFSIAAIGTNGFAAWSAPADNGTAGEQINVARWTGGNIARQVFTRTAGNVEAIDLQAADDGSGLVMVWTETDGDATITRETVRLARVDAVDLMADWGPLGIDADSAGGPVMISHMLRRPRLSVSHRGDLVVVGWEKRLTSGGAALRYTNSNVTTAPSYMTGTGQPSPLAMPIGAGSIPPAGVVIGIAGIGHGALHRLSVVPSAAPTMQGAAMGRPLAIADEQQNPFVVVHQGLSDNGGELVIHSIIARWPMTGLVLTSAAGRALPELVAVRRSGGGLIVAWTENRDSPSVWYQVVSADATKLAQ